MESHSLAFPLLLAAVVLSVYIVGSTRADDCRAEAAVADNSNNYNISLAKNGLKASCFCNLSFLNKAKACDMITSDHMTHCWIWQLHERQADGGFDSVEIRDRQK